MTKRRQRLRIGGNVWNSEIKRIKKKVSTANLACTNILRIIEHHKGVPFSNAISIYVTTIATSLTSILESIDQIEQIGQDFREEQDAPDDVWQEVDDREDSNEWAVDEIRKRADEVRGMLKDE